MHHSTPLRVVADAGDTATSRAPSAPNTPSAPPLSHAQPPLTPRITPRITPPFSQPPDPPTGASGFAAWFLHMCAQRQVDPSAVARACGFSHAAITHWRKTGAAPVPATCRLIADYFAPYPYLLVLQYAGHITSDDLRPSRDPDTLRLQMRLGAQTAAAVGATAQDVLPAPEDARPFNDTEMVERAKLAIAQVPGLPREAVVNLAHLIDLYTHAAHTLQTMQNVEQTRDDDNE